MRRSALVTASVIFGFAVACLSQTYYEASGQTAVFTLKAGAKTSAIHSGSVIRSVLNSSINVTTVKGNIVVTLPALQRGLADISLYDIAGRQIYRQHGYSGTSLRLETRTFAPGVYSMLVCVDGKKYSRRVAVSKAGRGE
jgi:hypothetical protein